MNEKSFSQINYSDTSETDSEKIESEIVLDIQEFLDKNVRNFQKERPMYENFSNARVPNFQFSDGVLMNFETMTIHLDIEFFRKKGFSKEQMIWAGYHEVAHWVDFIQEPEDFLANFEHIRDKSTETGKKIKEKMIEQGRSDTVEKIEREYQESLDNEDDPEKKKKSIDPFSRKPYKEFWHPFYNCLDDVYVNSLVGKRKQFRFGENGSSNLEVSDLYKDILFKGTDYSQLPKNLQFSYYLLRKSMLPEEELILSEPVEEILNRKIDCLGQEIFIKDIYKKLQAKKYSGINPSLRYTFIKEFIEPIFEELINLDLDEWDQEIENQTEQQNKDNQNSDDSRDENSNDQQSNSGESKNESQDDDNNTPGKSESGSEKEDQSNNSKPSDKQEGSDNTESSDSIESDGENDESESKNQDSENSQGQSGGEQKEGQGQESSSPKNLDDYFNPENQNSPQRDFSPEIPSFIDDLSEKDLDQKEIDKISKKIKDYLENKDQKSEKPKTKEDFQREIDIKWCENNDVVLEDFDKYNEYVDRVSPYIDQLSSLWLHIVGKGGGEYKKVKRPDKEGEINIDRFIKFKGDIESGKIDEVKPFDKERKEFIPTDKPELINFRFIGDTSGSMFDGHKIELLKEVYVLLMESFRKFNKVLNLERNKTKTKLRVDTEGWLYGSSLERFKKFNGKIPNYNQEKIDLIRGFSSMNNDRGYTFDDLAYSAIEKDFSDKDKKNVENGKTMEIIFQITDGEPDGGHEPNNQVDRLSDLGFIIRSFQIGIEDNPNSRFNQIWNSGDEKKGQVIGTDIKKLIPAITTTLQSHLKNIKL